MDSDPATSPARIRARLAAVLRSQWSSNSLIGEYIDFAEEAIREQARMVAAHAKRLPESTRITIWKDEEAAVAAAEFHNGGCVPGGFVAVAMAYPIGTTGADVTGWTVAQLPTRM